MKSLSIILFGVLALSSVSCSHMQSKNVAADNKRHPNSVEEGSRCLQNFKSASKRLVELVAENPTVYSKAYREKLQATVSNTEVVCTSDKMHGSYGFLVMGTKQIIVEDQLFNLSRLYDSKLGDDMSKKYKVNMRFVNFDRSLVAVAAQSYAWILGVKETEEYSYFYKTLKALDK